MQQRHVPGLGRDVPMIGAGCWTIGGSATNRGVPIGWSGVDEHAAFAGLERAHELGVRLYDTADVYGLGRSERLLGRLLGQIDRATVLVSSKVGYFAGTGPHPYQHRQMLHQFHTTLDNLGTDYLDLYHLHSTDFGPGDRYLDDAVQTILELQARGAIRAVGMRAPHTFAQQWAADPTHPHAEATARFLALTARIHPDVLTVRHNLLSPLYPPDQTDIFGFARQRDVGILLKQVLGQGLLLDVHDPAAPPTFPPDDHRHGDPRYATPTLRVIQHSLTQLARRFGAGRQNLARVAVHYALHADPNAVALVGFRSPEQIESSLAYHDRPLTSEDIEQIRHIMSPVRDILASSGTAAVPTTR
jgi:aryl-alcohol dehydrogenase-like predicted oxidoreductase